jgi:hypothetical protein
MDKPIPEAVRLRELAHEVATRGPKNWRPELLAELQAALTAAQQPEARGVVDAARIDALHEKWMMDDDMGVNPGLSLAVSGKINTGSTAPPSAPVGVDQAVEIMNRGMPELQRLLELRQYDDTDGPMEVAVGTDLLDAVMYEVRDTICRVAAGNPVGVSLAQQPSVAPVGVEEWQCRCGLRGPHSSFVAHADCPLRPAHALAQQPAAVECPHRTRCDCLASCKYGYASDGATQHQEPTTCKHDFRRDEDHGGACCQLCGEVRQ